MAPKRIDSFEEFWPFYVHEHAKRATRQWHFVGTSGVIACVAGAVIRRKLWPLLLAPVVGYGPAWFSHFFIENNRPASFTYPAWSLAADFKMWGLIAAGKMDEEVARVMATWPSDRASTAPEHAASEAVHATEKSATDAMPVHASN